MLWSVCTVQLADTFLGNIASGWDVQTDQSDLSSLRLSDLQTAKMDISGTALSATMKHKMGLVGITLNSTTIYDNYVYTYTSTTNQGSPTRTGANTWYGSSAINSSNVPFKQSNTMLFLIKKPSSGAVTVSATQSSVFNTYKQNKVFAWSTTAPMINETNEYKSVSVSYSGPPYLQAAWNIPCYSGIVSYSTPYFGKYGFKCWGANGGNGYSTYYYAGNGYREATTTEQNNGSCYCYGGKGGYTYGELSSLVENRTFYICVGAAGSNSSIEHLETNGARVNAQRSVSGGYNGGGDGSEWNNANVYVHNGGGGGGATHIATTTGLLQSLPKANILMVASGGGGAGGHEAADTGGAGGGINGSKGSKPGTGGGELSLGGSQSGGGGWENSEDYTDKAEKGIYGKGGSHLSGKQGGGGGGGSGYYGGAGGYWHGGGGGSSYINGHSGCTQQNTTYVFTGTNMIAGGSVATSAPNPSGNNNGYAIIEYTYIP